MRKRRMHNNNAKYEWSHKPLKEEDISKKAGGLIWSLITEKSRSPKHLKIM